jgi:hypothetical protein
MGQWKWWNRVGHRFRGRERFGNAALGKRASHFGPVALRFCFIENGIVRVG